MSDSTSAIFISYAREDSVAADRIAEALRSHGLEVWFDQNELRGGEAWDQKIRNQIRTCSLLIPLVSANTQGRGEGYFRREWKLAAERTHDMAGGIPFLVPVVIDDIAESTAMVPEEFMKVQWTRLPHGRTTPEFAAQVRRLLEAPRAAATVDVGRGRRTPPREPVPANPAGFRDPALQPKPRASGVPIWAVTAGGVVLLGAVIYFALRPTAKEPTAPAKIAAETTVTPAVTAPAPVAQKTSSKSIAVLPLANMSEDKDTGFFADGVHEDLLTNLALIGDLKVVSRTTMTQYRGTTKSMKQIGEELGVAYILEGSVRRSGNKVRVTGQLINARTDEHVWAKSYDRDLTDIFAIQATLAQEIASALQAAITPQAQKFIERRPTENPLAYDDYLKGRDTRNRAPTASQAALDASEKFFQDAVTLDPKFAAAWAELAVVHALKVFWDRDGSEERKAMGEAAVAQALRLAPDAPEVIRNVGTYAYYAHRDYAAATAAYEKILRSQPNDPTAYASLGLIRRRQGRWAEAITALHRAIELDPANVGYNRNLLSTFIYTRHWAEAEIQQRRLIALLPGQPHEELNLADISFSATGSFKAIDELLARLTPSDANSTDAVYYRKYWAWARDDYAEFKRLDQMQPFNIDNGETPGVAAGWAAEMHLAHGDVAAARARIAESYPETLALTAKEPGNMRAQCYLAAMEAVRGNSAEAVRLARRVVELFPETRDAIDGSAGRWWLADVYAITGNKDRALAELSRLVQIPGQNGLAKLRTDPAFASLRGDPRFEEMMNDPKNNAPLF